MVEDIILVGRFSKQYINGGSIMPRKEAIKRIEKAICRRQEHEDLDCKDCHKCWWTPAAHAVLDALLEDK